MEQPEKVGRVFGGRGGAAFGQDRFPEAFELGGLILTDPGDHLGRALSKHLVERQRLRAGGAGVEFALALEHGEVLDFDGTAHRRDQNRGMVAGLCPREFQRHQQRWGKVLGRDRSRDFGGADFLVGFVEAARSHGPLSFGAVVDPGFLILAFDPPASFLLHRFQPRVDSFLATLGADFGRVNLEGHPGESLAVQAAQIGLIGVEIDGAQPLAGDAAAGDGLEISRRRLDLDGLLLDQFIPQFRVPKVADCFLVGEEKRLFQLAADEWGVGLGGFVNRPAAGFFREEDLGDIEERIDAGDLMDFLADEVDGLWIGRDGHAHAFFGTYFFDPGWGVAAVSVIAAAALERSALAAFTRATALWPAVVAAWRTVFGKYLWFMLWLAVASSTRPRGAEGKTR